MFAIQEMRGVVGMVLLHWVSALGQELAVVVVSFVVVAAVAAILRRRRLRLDRAALRPPAALRAAAGAVILCWVVGQAASLGWWRFALPVAAAMVGAVIVAVTHHRAAGGSIGGSAVLPRRTWHSFVRPGWLWAASAAFAVLTLATVWAGLLSSPWDNGTYIALRDPNGGVAWPFYGWHFGMPVLIALVLLAGASAAALSTVAAPSFSSSTLLLPESERRRTISEAIVRLAFSTSALVLGSVLSLLGTIGFSLTGASVPGVVSFTSTPGFSAFAWVFLVAGIAMQFGSAILLLTLAVGDGAAISVPGRAAAATAGSSA
jgi:hypothetical protein